MAVEPGERAASVVAREGGARASAPPPQVAALTRWRPAGSPKGTMTAWSRAGHREIRAVVGVFAGYAMVRLAAADGIARHASLRWYVFVAGAAVTALATSGTWLRVIGDRAAVDGFGFPADPDRLPVDHLRDRRPGAGRLRSLIFGRETGRVRNSSRSAAAPL